eukprot:CAMPEP_0206463986 /NCGR_PEP_ID=MMETSP0324_2-20121206/26943_1 /ASSEMBLY_ACC=CAM_ASM_000836 /TAXON_ID=2866 /ORGANISM="Crypthecodinium cohnii, Strain Seligo" /LENGTH=112 /DNA_ID=CAMNT_0053936523 /DNA_START=279 /DNA_END=613 /DNA_ORIENTATION=-
MHRMKIQRASGTEHVALVDIVALQSHCIGAGGASRSVKNLLESRRLDEVRRREAAERLVHLQKVRSSPELQGLAKLNYDERLARVQARKQQTAVDAYLHKMNNRRDKDGPTP